MKLTALTILKHMGMDKEPILLGMACDLSSFNYFQRGTAKETIRFFSRTVAKRTPEGERHSTEIESYTCHAYNRGGLIGIAFVDQEYPMRAAHSVVAKVIDEYMEEAGAAWKAATADDSSANAVLEPAVSRYQNPEEADKLMKVQKDLEETKVILHKTIDSVLARGEKLDSLVDKSSDLSMASQMFYKQAKKQNQCCQMG